MGLFDSVTQTVQNIADSPIWYANPWTAAAKGVYEGGQWAYDKYKGNPYRGQNWGAFGTSEGGFNWGMVPFVGQGFTNERNLQYQKENRDYQMALQQQMFQREDTSIARRTKDLVMSGLSPVLAAGSGAGAGPAIATKALESADTSGAAMQMMALITGLSGLQTQAEQRKNIQSQTGLNYINQAIKQHDYNIFKKTNTTSNSGALLNNIRNALGFTESPIVEPIKNKLIEKSKKVEEKLMEKVEKGQSWFKKHDPIYKIYKKVKED